MNIQQAQDTFVQICKEELGTNLTGVYLHGSLAMSGFHEASSDVDFIVVIRNRMQRDQALRIAHRSLALHDAMPNPRGLEYSVLLEEHLRPFRYPTPLQLHYSDFHRERYRNDPTYLCGGMEDVDTASQLMVALQRGTCLFGEPLSSVCEPIKREYFVDSIYRDIEDAVHNIEQDPVYAILNLCRVLYYLEQGVLASKTEGGEWAMEALPDMYQPLIEASLAAYSGTSESDFVWQAEQLQAFAAEILGKINILIQAESHT